MKGLTGGGSFRERMAELGVVRGIRLGIVKNDHVGPLIVSVGEGRLALGRGMASKILVEEA
ncbi:MAG: ferrous iron transport protein A [Firmicutes bacterium]|nr:ferrous iron transport protein A [Bacillota bacterium]MCL5039215.1 ferrous iron transport protein A [Bacillota bacterium]